MDKKNDEVSIKQVNPPTDFNDFEKTAIMEYDYLKKQEELSKTQKFRILNEDKRKFHLGETIKSKISEKRKNIEEEEVELPQLSKKKSLYDTVIIKLDDLINQKNAIKFIESKKVTSIEEPKKKKKTFFMKKNPGIINIDQENFGSYIYSLNKMALEHLSRLKPKEVRKASNATKLKEMEQVFITQEDFKQYEHELNKFAINKLYYKMAPKESKKYKIYKYGLLLTCFMLFVVSFLVVGWYLQGRKVLEISQSLKEDIEVEKVDGGELFNVFPDSNHQIEIKDENLYTKYLNTPFSSVNIEEVKKSNEDTIGWLIVPNTNVNYPVVQTNDNLYYLKHSFDKTSNPAGWVFADYRNNFSEFSDNTVIYAHGRKDKVMFGSLTNALDYSWYSVPENQLIHFSTEEYNTLWQIFSIYKIEAESYYITTDFSSKDTLSTFATIMKNRSIYDFGVSINEGDKFLTLSTCYNDSGIRLVIQAKLVKMQKR